MEKIFFNELKGFLTLIIPCMGFILSPKLKNGLTSGGELGNESADKSDDREFDCVDIYKQPALDHPLLQNHKIQMTPSFSGKVLKNYDIPIGKFSEIGIQDEGCPSGMYATLFPSLEKGGYHGAQAFISLENPAVSAEQFSMAQIWVQSGPNGHAALNSIQAGWGVHPGIYNDTLTRFTAYWTADNYRDTGCFNILCSGFVQVHPSIFLGAPYRNTSIYQGQLFVTDIMISQDKTSGHWWLIVHNLTKIGYWPKEILPQLSNEANFVQFGSMTHTTDSRSPPMGNGRFPNDNLSESSSFTQMKTINSSYIEDDIDFSFQTYVSSKACYNVDFLGDQGPDYLQTMVFGGPGGLCGI
ncbi:protein neprosin-like [Castanea sativa]|uniref:protein neprosin-like n=1 Tax=Castanea sativa TaxID=21020 RepID=UPI003F64B2C3